MRVVNEESASVLLVGRKTMSVTEGARKKGEEGVGWEVYWSRMDE